MVLGPNLNITMSPELPGPPLPAKLWEPPRNSKFHQSTLLGSLEALSRLSWPLLVCSWGSLGTSKLPLWRVLVDFLAKLRLSQKVRKPQISYEEFFCVF